MKRERKAWERKEEISKTTEEGEDKRGAGKEGTSSKSILGQEKGTYKRGMNIFNRAE